MKSNAFGLDIGTSEIKAVWLNHEKNLFIYNTSLSVPAPQQGMQSESPFDQQEMAKIINKLVIDAKITTNNVNIALPENHVFTKVIEMPVLSEKELTSAIYWEAEQYIPAPLDTMVLDHSILQKHTNSLSEQKMQVLLVGAPILLVKRYQMILELAGLSIVSIETEILSLIRGLLGNEHFPTSLIINIGAFNTSMCIVQNGFLVSNYSFPLGGNVLTRAIAVDFGFNHTQADEYKRAYGLVDENIGGKIGKAIDPILNSLISEVKKALTFYNDTYKNESTISQILLTGGSANLPGIGIYFAKYLGIETVIANPWRSRNIQRTPKEIDDRGPEHTVALGLALKEYE